MNNRVQCYFVQNKVLLRKWLPHRDVVVDKPVIQVVVPVKYRDTVLKIAHASGHLGVRKTCEQVLRYLFWPKLRKDISAYIKSCHTCQLTSKPNQMLEPVPLSPIAVITQPFKHLIIDCVGPSLPSKSGCC